MREYISYMPNVRVIETTKVTSSLNFLNIFQNHKE